MFFQELCVNKVGWDEPLLGQLLDKGDNSSGKYYINVLYEGLPQPSPPPLPKFRVREEPTFNYTGVDFAGPLYIKTSGPVASNKVWICLYNICCVMRAAHLDIVPDMTAASFLNSFKCFTARRGFPRKVILDNGKTFKAAAKSIQAAINHPDM